MNLTFFRYYEQLRNEKSEFIHKICEITGKSKKTVYNWINGKYKISDADKEKIAGLLDSDINVLFPKNSLS